jgi:two-component system response regulator
VGECQAREKSVMAPHLLFRFQKGRRAMSNQMPMTILLVEDNDFDAEFTMRALQPYNLYNQIVRFADGQEALDFLFQTEIPNGDKKRVNPKLILLDLKLPGVSGMEVLQTVKNNLRTKCIPIVVLTSSTEEEDIVKSYELGVNSFISKPVEFDQFMESMKNLGLYWLLLNKTPYCR